MIIITTTKKRKVTLCQASKDRGECIKHLSAINLEEMRLLSQNLKREKSGLSCPDLI